jgi:hypothetical protein
MRSFVALAVMLEIVVARGCTLVRAEAAKDLRPAIVRIYNYAQIPPPMLKEATRGAAAIFDAAGLTSQWRICTIRQNPSGREDPACEGSPGTYEFSLRINQGPDATAPQRSSEVLGYAVILERRGIVATVHSGRVLALASRSGVDPVALMGRVMAHEVGHLLLGTNEHAARGLMRAAWKLNVWSMSEHSDWTFSEDEVSRMRQSATPRARN